MKKIISPRRSGRTNKMIQKSHLSRATIVCLNAETVEDVFMYAKEHGYVIPEPITFDQFLRINFPSRGSSIRKHSGFLIDNADLLLQRIAGTVPVEAITMCKEDDE